MKLIKLVRPYVLTKTHHWLARAGVIQAHFDKIHKGQVTFVYQYCELSLSKAVHQQLQSELQALKEQLTEVKRVLQTDTAGPHSQRGKRTRKKAQVEDK